MSFNSQEFRARRDQLIQQMGEGVAIIPTSPEAIRNRDSHYPYRFDSYFYYLTGFKEPEAVLFVMAGKSPKTILFCRDKDIEREIWDGFRFGPDAAKEIFGFDEAYSIQQLDEMRLIKSPFEIDLMHRSANIAAAAHQRAIQFTKPGMMEYEVEAEFLHEFYRRGAQAPAYTSIVAGGANACTLHYNANNTQLHDGDLLLIDAGCELDGYASDITRTFPVNGKFSPAQKDLYQLVLAAQAAAIEKVAPGQHWNAPHEAALKVLAQGFIDLGLCQGTVDAVIESGSYRQFYMHRTGHWLGLDVHDAGEYKDKQDAWRVLEPGMTLTIEPGCYVRPADKVPEHFWNIGIRIEDDAIVTSTVCEIMTKAAPKTISEIEDLMHDD